MAFDKLQELQGDFSKEERVPFSFFENSNEIQKLNAYLPCIRI